jgi:hypothetical protein
MCIIYQDGEISQIDLGLPFFKFSVGAVFYRYYEGGVSSVYLWDLDEDFAGVVLLKKSTRWFRDFAQHTQS